jgi:hypothetical protein
MGKALSLLSMKSPDSEFIQAKAKLVVARGASTGRLTPAAQSYTLNVHDSKLDRVPPASLKTRDNQLNAMIRGDFLPSEATALREEIIAKLGRLSLSESQVSVCKRIVKRGKILNKREAVVARIFLLTADAACEALGEERKDKLDAALTEFNSRRLGV